MLVSGDHVGNLGTGEATMQALGVEIGGAKCMRSTTKGSKINTREVGLLLN